VVEIDLTPHQGETSLRLVHRGLDGRWPTLMTGAGPGRCKPALCGWRPRQPPHGGGQTICPASLLSSKAATPAPTHSPRNEFPPPTNFDRHDRSLR
jgi:hypothetical protein